MAVAGNIIVDKWTVRGFDGNPVTGMAVPTHVTLTLWRQSGSTIIAAAESVSWTEIGATGTYYFAFTPQNSGRYKLDVREIGAATALRIETYTYDVSPAGALFLPSYANAFCSEADIERWIQQAISASSKPTDDEAAAFAESRAALLMSLCARLGFAVTPASIESGSRLQDLLREANAIGAAMDITIAQFFTEAPSKSDRAEELNALWNRYVGEPTLGPARAIGYLELEIRANLSSLATNHILSGDTAARSSSGTPTDSGIQVTMGDTF